eukprot:TRINITY_DN403_c0_g1_i1.p1 TRINITY_DN403_c0_g1~~TRINITY_DN403_c0_g1_i1.p1  ORF type:complete len:307 (-),score=54.74 TRINITY_DN403_c0_g1_i1:25-945(-)
MGEGEAARVFKRSDRWDVYEVVKTILCAVLLLPARAGIILATCLVFNGMCKLALVFMKDEVLYSRPLTPLRKYIVSFGQLAARICLFALGFWDVKIIGSNKLKEKQGKAHVYIANHTSWIDILVLLATSESICSFVAKRSIATLPLFASDGKAVQCIYIDRLSVHEGISGSILDRVKRHDMPPLIIFPEGTTTNGRYLLKFHKGAFLPGDPVKPALIRYTYNHFNPSWESVNAMHHIFRILTQVKNYVEIEYLPVYIPSEEERDDPEKYAHAVQMMMAEKLKVEATEYSYPEKIRYLRSKSKGRTP